VLAGTFFGVLGVVAAVLVGAWLWLEGTRELVTVRMRHTGSPFGRAFGRGAFGPFAFGGRGFDARRTPDEDGGSERDADADGARRPAAQPPPGGRGFSDEDVRRLEEWRGPLRRFEE